MEIDAACASTIALDTSSKHVSISTPFRSVSPVAITYILPLFNPGTGPANLIEVAFRVFSQTDNAGT